MSQRNDLFDAAISARRSGDLATARRHCEAILEYARGDFRALMLLGDIQSDQGQRREACQSYELAIGQQPKDVRARLHAGNALLGIGEPRRAMKQFDAVRRLEPTNAVAAAGLATAHEMNGKHARARRALEGIADGPNGLPPLEVAAARMRLLLHEGDLDAARSLGRQVEAADWGDAAGSAPHRSALYSLAKACERSGDCDAAFAAATAANRLAETGYDPAAVDAMVDGLIQTQTAKAITAAPAASDPTELPVCIVGMPRCGSTLTDRIIHAHPSAVGLGELGTIDVVPVGLAEAVGLPPGAPPRDLLPALTRDAVDAVHEGWRRLAKRRAPKATRVTNKELFNLLHLGLIGAVMPTARIIHCVRSPADTALSCYMERLPLRSCAFATDLEHVAHWWRAQDRLVRHFRTAVPNPWLEVAYEDLVADPDTTVRAILDFLDLPFDERCLRFHEVDRVETTASYEQVRQPLYAKSVGRSARFAAHLGPIGDLPATERVAD